MIHDNATADVTLEALFQAARDFVALGEYEYGCADVLTCAALAYAQAMSVDRAEPAPFLSCLQCGKDARRPVGSTRFCDSVCSGKWWSERARLAMVGQ